MYIVFAAKCAVYMMGKGLSDNRFGKYNQFIKIGRSNDQQLIVVDNRFFTS